MLVISRKSGDAIRINDQISIKVLGVHGKKVRLGIEAPANVKVDREEIIKQLLTEEIQKIA